ncbi:MAG: hypothetical protein J0M05_06780 [Candidatus Kapabacteria bacterium]|jgi:hypothetical protein|nr:hypothetical protein [Ignavibacteria bacterium]MBN8573599.1 hypothetical protein [Candidatus Kapabacteria bacterium]
MSNFIDLLESQLSKEYGLEFVEKEIMLLFLAISKTETFDETELIFKNLEDIQLVLAKAIFKNKMEVSEFLSDFVSNFDRIDDIITQKILYEEIKSKYTN